MTRYPALDAAPRPYVCSSCGHELPAFQGLYWFSRSDPDNDRRHVPYCPRCGSTAIARPSQ